MATATPIIQTIFTVADRASPVFVKINQRMSVVNRTAQQTQQRLEAVGKATGGLGAAIGIGAVITGFKKAIEITSDYEQQVLRLTGVIEGMGAMKTHKDAINASVVAYEKLNRMAAALPGETQDYVTVFERGLPEALKAGATDMDQIANFTSRFAAVMMDAKHNADNVGESLNKMLSLHPRMMQRDIVIRMLRIANITEQTFRKMNAAERLDTVKKALGTMEGMIQEQAKSIDAIYGAVTANAKMALVSGMRPILNELTGGAFRINEYFERNRESIAKTVEQAGLLLIKLGHIALVAKAFTTLGGVALSKKLFNLGVTATTGTAGLISRGIGATGAAARGIAGVGEAMDIFSKFSIVGRVMSMFIASAPIIGALATAITGFGIVIVLAGVLRGLFSDIVNNVADIRNRLLSAIGLLADTLSRLIPTIDGKQSRLGEFLEAMIYGFSFIIESIRAAAVYVYTLLSERSFDSAIAAYNKSLFEFVEAGRKAIAGATVPKMFETTGAVGPFDVRAPADLSGKDKGTEIKFYNARFDIKQQFAEGFDPDRIAVAFANGIARMGEMKVYSQFSPAVSSGN